MVIGEELRHAFACVTKQPFQLIQTPDSSSRFTFEALPRNRAVQLSSHSLPVSVQLSVHIEIPSSQIELAERRFDASIAAYSIALRTDDGVEVITSHWHPNGLSNIRDPHLHVSGRFSSPYVANAHLPTGMVATSAIIRMLIRDLGIVPIRTDWNAVLSKQT